MMFLSVVNEMIRLKFNFDGFKLMNLRKKAMASKDLPASDWVMQKMDSLNK